MDILSPEERSRLMASIRAKDTKPEVAVRRMLHAMGYRFRLHRRELPGTPDIVLAARRSVIEVRGCFWHQHPGCPRARVPATRPDYWMPKLSANVARDARNCRLLRRSGWRVAVVWECQIGRDPGAVARRLRRFLG
jgi:DNA mismatch endonuclease Vsr